MTKKLYMVETLTTFVHRYAVEAESLDHAYDEVTMMDSGSDSDYFEPIISMAVVTDMVVDGREIDMDEFNRMQKDKNANSPWMGERLIRRIKYVS